MAEARRAVKADTQAEWKRVWRPEPWPDPANRDSRTVADERRSELGDAFAVKKDAAEALAVRAAQARSRLRPLDRLSAVVGLPTAAARAARQAEEAAQVAAEDLAGERDELRARTDEAEEYGRREAGRRSRDQIRWEQSGDVVAARERGRLNEEAVRRMAQGDPGIMAAVAGGDLVVVRAEVQRREAEERRQAEARLVLEEVPHLARTSSPRPR